MSLSHPTSMTIFESSRWMNEIIAYLNNQMLPSDKLEAQKLLQKGREDPSQREGVGIKFTIVAVDYFTKWCEAEPLAKITEENTWKFVWKNVIYHFGIPHSLVSDNSTQFTRKKFNSNCKNLGIQRDFSTSYYPQANGQVEAVNKIIKHTLKRKLEFAQGGWAKELPETLWSYRTTSQDGDGRNPFCHGIRSRCNDPRQSRDTLSQVLALR
ncbi:Pol polyprotein [Abeliophyllum distichum]|uniref:Pol polyprotein n=1 Tax=Abeliophyllum distichum TaxID=126358 RepID=A0ABD1QGT5_9LAMI